MMSITFSMNAWEDYTSWQADDNKMISKINSLIKDIKAHPFEGTGKPEPLKYDLAGLWSRRIDREQRLVYQSDGDALFIYCCRYHYDL